MANATTTEDNIYKQYEVPASSGGVYLKLEDGKPVKVRIASEPYIFKDAYQGRVSTRYAWVVYNLTADAAQVLQLPPTAFTALQNIAADDDWGLPTAYNVTITRNGKGKDTKYSITPTPNKLELTDEQKAACEEIDMATAIPNAITIREKIAGKEVPDAIDRSAQSDDDGPSAADREASAPAKKETWTPSADVVLDDLPF